MKKLIRDRELVERGGWGWGGGGSFRKRGFPKCFISFPSKSSFSLLLA